MHIIRSIIKTVATIDTKPSSADKQATSSQPTNAPPPPKAYTRLLLLIVPLMIVGGILLKDARTPFATETLTNGTYTYTFRFYHDANEIRLSDKTLAYVHGDDEVAGVKPEAIPMITKCSQISSAWKQVFTVRVYGAEHPVCTPNHKGFVLYFPALGGKHLFTVTYKKAQTSATYPTLKMIFTSVTVSKQSQSV